ncbi:MAG: DNA-directed RNA polymerase subunit beta, partial [Bacteroidia bacterium]|nr:DNA-directed RNA polymerase subunit beta [Bacteroidia bacterium]
MTQQTKSGRISFARAKVRFDYPDFLEIQVKSFRKFFSLWTTPEERKKEGLYQVFTDYFPINDTRNSFVLEFVDYYIEPSRYTIEECIERGLTYSVSLKARLRLYCTDKDHVDFDTSEQDVFLGSIPDMTNRGTFVINGAERVVVSQLHRSPGVFFSQTTHNNGTKLYSARIIPFRGAWIEFSTDINNVMYAYIDRKKKMPVTMLLRALDYSSDSDILKLYDLGEEVEVTQEELEKHKGRALAGKVVRETFEEFVDEATGEVVNNKRIDEVLDRGAILDDETIPKILESGERTILLRKDDDRSKKFDIIYDTFAKDSTTNTLDAQKQIYRIIRSSDPPDEVAAKEHIEKLFFSEKRYDLGKVGRYKINRRLHNDGVGEDVRVLDRRDIVKIIEHLIELRNSRKEVDDIDHLSNRRVRTVGEQLANQFGIGLARMTRTIRERMNVRDSEVFTASDLINSKALSSVINSFFGTNQLSQFMDQTNPLAEMTHKRRLSALGPGGLTRERAGFEVR